MGGIVERIERESESTRKGAADGFLEGLRRIGTVPPEGLPAAVNNPPGPQPGTVAYTVRVR